MVSAGCAVFGSRLFGPNLASKRAVPETQPTHEGARRLAAAMGIALVAAAAAAVGKEPVPPPVPMPGQYERQAPAQVLPPAALDRWWLLFGDPTLDALEDEA